MSPATRSNLILIGMPGAGKSTVGVILAKRLGMAYVDTDLLIQVRHEKSLQALIDERGLEAFGCIEEEVLCGLDVRRSVISTGGSAVYSDAAMKVLRQQGRTLFLDVPLPQLKERITNMGDRGMVIAPGSSLEDLYRQRHPLYRRYADLYLDASEGSAEQIARKAAELWLKRSELP